MFIATNRIKVKTGSGDTLAGMFRGPGRRPGFARLCQL